MAAFELDMVSGGIKETQDEILTSMASLFSGQYSIDPERYLNDYIIMKAKFDDLFHKLAVVEKLSEDYKEMMLNLRELKEELTKERQTLKEMEASYADFLIGWKMKTVDPSMPGWDRVGTQK